MVRQQLVLYEVEPVTGGRAGQSQPQWQTLPTTVQPGTVVRDDGFGEGRVIANGISVRSWALSDDAVALQTRDRAGAYRPIVVVVGSVLRAVPSRAAGGSGGPVCAALAPLRRTQ